MVERLIFMPISTSEKILSEDYFDLIVPITGSDTDFEETFARFGPQAAVPGYGILHIDRQFLPENILNVIEYSNIPKLYSLMDTSALERSGILKVQTQSLLGYQGEGVLIGFLDTGIDFTHPAFRTSDGRSRIYRLWDQTIQSENVPDGFFYGSQYTNDDLNKALEQEDPYEVVPSVDENGHGTFLASVAAGTALPLQDFSGAAPRSEIVAVKLKPAKENLREFFLIRESAVAYQETDIMLALRYLIQCARQAQKPLVLCFALGTNQGDHSGYMPLSEALDSISRMSDIYVISAAGNEAGKGHHFYGKTENTSGYQNVEVLVPENERGFTMELWASPPDLFAIGMVSPLGETIPPVPPRAGPVTSISFLLEQTVVELSYEPVEIASGGQLVFLRIQNPTPGIWGFQIYPRQISSGIFHIWLPVSGFSMDNTRFLNSNPDTTIVCPSNAEGVITCSAYNHATGGLFIQSSRGYSRTGTVKPDIAAPGVDVYGALSSSSEFARQKFGVRTGTSISAALTAGAAALLVNWGLKSSPPRYFTNREIKSLLIRGADRSSNLLYPNREWGYGTLNLYQIFQSLL